MLQARKAVMSPQPAPAPRYQPAGKPLQQKKHRRVGLKRKLFLLLLGCFLLGLVIIAQYSSMVALNYRLSQAETRLKELDAECRQLEQEAAQLSSLSRIELIARTELGMREPESGQLMVLTASRERASSMGE